MDFSNRFSEGIEGYLSSKETFNGVLFLLREPNSSEQKRFWFKDCMEKEEKGSLSDESGVSKRQYTKYKKIFERLLEYTGIEGLQNCAYANIKPDSGCNVVSAEYKTITNDEKADRIDSLFKACNPKVAFVCGDMFDALISKRNMQYSTGEGIRYNKTRLRKGSYNGIAIFETYHPSYRGSYPERP